MKTWCSRYLTCALAVVSSCIVAEASEPVGTGFSYSGSLAANGNQASGLYDLKFTLFDSLTNGSLVAPPLTNSATLINNGLFNVALDFGPAAFNGQKRWVEIGVRTNGSPGDFESLAPRQELVPQPYALYAANSGIAAAALTVAPGVLSGPFALTNSGNTFMGDGSGLSGVNAATLNGNPAADFWQTGGNAGTAAGVNFLGTTDNQPLEIKVNGQRVMRLEPTETGPPNLILGWSNNVVIEDSGTSEGMTVSGGAANTIENGTYSTIGGGIANYIGGGLQENSTISGGSSNSIEYDFSYDSTIGGGNGNTIDSSALGTISGGEENLMLYGYSSTIGGGISNVIDTFYDSVIGGGHRNRVGKYPDAIDGDGSTISGGIGNFAIQNYGTIGGGLDNSVTNFANQSGTIGGGMGNVVNGSCGTIPGGAHANARLPGQMAYANGQFSSVGDAQTSLYVCRGITTNATQRELYLDGASARMVVPTNSTWSFEILISGRASNGNSAAYRFLGVIKNINGLTSLVGSPVKNALGQDVASWDANVGADNANQALMLNVTGAAATSIRWVANVRTSEVMY